MNIILFGPPGAGKGTQAYNIVKFFNMHIVSAGDLLRDEVQKHSDLGSKIKSLMDKGSFVPDDIIDDLIVKILSDSGLYNRLVFDGYPRNLNQAKNLDNLLNNSNQKISCVLSLKVDQDIIIKRILGRQVCSNCGMIFNEYFKPATTDNHNCDVEFLRKRSDDNETTIKRRVATYDKETFPILNHYSKQKLLHQIDGIGEIKLIYQEIRNIIASLET